MYFGLFCIGELASGAHPVLARDMHIAKNKRKILFVLRTSKTLYKNMKPQLVKIMSTQKKGKTAQYNSKDSSKLPCPYELLKKYLKLRGHSKTKNEPFFIFSDRLPVKPEHVHACFKLMIHLAQFTHPKLYQVHRICAGRSCNLLKLG